MLTKVEVYGPYIGIDPLILNINGIETDSIQIHDIDGLGPVKANINTSPFGSVDGESYMGSSVGKRNIIMALGLNPNWVDQTVSGLRNILYGYFMPKQPIRLRFFSTDLPTTEAVGFVESCEPNIFSKDPEMQVSIICPVPDFVAVDPIVITGVVNDAGIDPGYIGTVPTGFVVGVMTSVALPSYTGNITIENNTEVDQKLIVPTTVDGTYRFEASSRQGEKYTHKIVTATGVVASLLSGMTDDSVWPIFKPGENLFQVNAETAGQSWTLVYFNRFGGL